MRAARGEVGQGWPAMRAVRAPQSPRDKAVASSSRQDAICSSRPRPKVGLHTEMKPSEESEASQAMVANSESSEVSASAISCGAACVR